MECGNDNGAVGNSGGNHADLRVLLCIGPAESLAIPLICHAPTFFHLHAEHAIHSVSSEVYSALLALLIGCSVPKKERTPHVVAAYRIKNCIMCYGTEPTKWSGGQSCN